MKTNKILLKAKERGLKTREALAKAAGITTETLRLILNGNHLPSMRTLEALASVLGETPKQIALWLIEGLTESKPSKPTTGEGKQVASPDPFREDTPESILEDLKKIYKKGE